MGVGAGVPGRGRARPRPRPRPTILALAVVLSGLVGPLPLVPLGAGPAGAGPAGTGPVGSTELPAAVRRLSVRPIAALGCGTAVDAAAVDDPGAALRDAVAAAADAEPGCAAWTVVLAGTFDLSDPLVHSARIPLRLVGPSDGRAVLRSDGSGRLVTVRRPAYAVELVRLELHGGDATAGDLDGVGGAVGAELAPDGDPEPSRVTVADALLIGNVALAGGAIAADEVVLTDVDLVDNAAPLGGAVDVATLVAVRTQFVANRATPAPGQGGAVRAGGDVTLTSVTFAANAADVGGSVWLLGLTGPVLRATATTFASARADLGGHVAGDLTAGGSVRLVLRGSVLAAASALAPGGPAPDLCAGVVGSGAADGPDAAVGSVAADASCPGATRPDAAVLLAPLGGADGTVAGRDRLFVPLAGGPLVDLLPCAGVWPEVDARGLARPQPTGGACDAGAVELAVAPPGVPPGVDPPGGAAPDAGSTAVPPRPRGVPTGWSTGGSAPAGRDPGRILRRRSGAGVSPP
jgi:hypothetical protein